MAVKKQGTNNPNKIGKSDIDKFSNAVSDLSTTLSNFSTDFSNNNQQFVSSLRNVLKTADSDFDDTADDVSEKVAEVVGKLDKTAGKHVNKFQIISSAAIDSLKVVFDYAIDKFTSASKSIIENYNQNLTDITVRQGWSNHEYTQALQKATDKIKELDLTTQFSQIDWTKSLQEVLATGLRDIGDDQIASQLATQNMITNKLLPQLSTTSRTYARASKLLGDGLGKSVTAIGKYTEQVYGAEGLEDRQIDNFMDTMLTKIAVGGAERGLSKEQVQQEVANAYGVYQQYASILGAEGNEAVLSDLRDILSGNWENANVMAKQAAQVAGLQFGDSSMTPTQMAKFYESYLNSSLYYGRGIGSGMMASTGYGQEAVYDAAKLWQAYGKDVPDYINELSGKVDANAEYNKELGKLQGNYYQNITDQQTKWNENVVANLSDLAAEKIPDSIGVTKAIQSILQIWFTAWLAMRGVSTVNNALANAAGTAGGATGNALANAAGAAGGAGVLSSMFGGASSVGSALGNAGAAAELLQEGATFGEAASVGGAGSATLGALSFAVGPLMLAAGLYSAGKSGYRAGTRAKANEFDVSSVAAQGFLTGSNTAGMSWQEKQAYYDQNGYFSIKDALKNAGKGALIGGGIGTIGAGFTLGTSTAIGAGIGAGVGLVSSIADQVAEAYDFKKFSAAMQEATESTQALAEANTKYDQTITKTQSALENIKTIEEANYKATSETTAALNNLKNLYPQHAKGLGDIDNLDKDYIETLKAKIEREEYLNELNAYQNWEEVVKKDFAKEAGVKTYGKGVGEFVADQAIIENTPTGILEYANKYYKKYGYENAGDYIKALRKAKVITGTSLSAGPAVNVISKSGIDTYERETDQAEQVYGQYLEDIVQKYATLENSYLEFKDENATDNAREQAKKNVIKYIPDLTTQMQNMKAYAEQIGYSERYRDDVKLSFPMLADIYNVIGKKPSNLELYGKGSDYITSDRLGGLHRGEAVITPPVAEKLRTLATGFGGISGFINSLFNIGNVQASALPESTELSLDPIVDAIKEQTKELKESLTEIIGMMTIIVDPTSLNSSKGHNYNLVNYRGA